MSSVVKDVVSGNERAVARLIRDIENGAPETGQTLKALFPYTGKAYVIGFTGAPGVGKSTLVDRMIRHLRKKGRSVGVLAIDPSSPFSGGALLGDRIRMQRHSLDKGVFIRSLATRGQFGGLTRSVRPAIDVLDAMGKDYIIVETVGVGQGEIDIVKNAHTTVIVVIPGMGDDIQAIKAGILEAGDIFLINKSDRPGAEKTYRELTSMLDIQQKRSEQEFWRPSVLMTEAKADKGVGALLEQVEKHRQLVESRSTAENFRSKKERVRSELADLTVSRMIEETLAGLVGSEDFEKAVDAVARGDESIYTVCEELISKAFFRLST